MNYFLLEDDPFALKPCLMKPFCRRAVTTNERICNYRKSRSRKGILLVKIILFNPSEYSWPQFSSTQKWPKHFLQMCGPVSFHDKHFGMGEQCNSEHILPELDEHLDAGKAGNGMRNQPCRLAKE